MILMNILMVMVLICSIAAIISVVGYLAILHNIKAADRKEIEKEWVRRLP